MSQVFAVPGSFVDNRVSSSSPKKQGAPKNIWKSINQPTFLDIYQLYQYLYMYIYISLFGGRNSTSDGWSPAFIRFS